MGTISRFCRLYTTVALEIPAFDNSFEGSVYPSWHSQLYEISFLSIDIDGVADPLETLSPAMTLGCRYITWFLPRGVSTELIPKSAWSRMLACVHYTHRTRLIL